MFNNKDKEQDFTDERNFSLENPDLETSVMEQPWVKAGVWIVLFLLLITSVLLIFTYIGKHKSVSIDGDQAADTTHFSTDEQEQLPVKDDEYYKVNPSYKEMARREVTAIVPGGETVGQEEEALILNAPEDDGDEVEIIEVE